MSRSNSDAPGSLGTSTEWTARTLVPRRSASANANAAAGSLAGEPSAANTTGPPLGSSGVRGVMTMTGQVACSTTPAEVEPIAKSSRAVSPRLPTTMAEAARPASISAPTGLSAITRNDALTSEVSSASWSRIAPSTLARAVSSNATTRPTARSAEMISSGALWSRAQAAAHATARRASREPS